MFHHTLISPPESFDYDVPTIEQIFHAVGDIVPEAQNGMIHIAIISDEEMQRLNREYRKIDSTTDVLSFHYFEDFSDCEADDVAGEIVLSESRILSQAVEHDHSPEKEASILILHGLLHILGYDHETDEEFALMWDHEERIRSMLALSTKR